MLESIHLLEVQRMLLVGIRKKILSIIAILAISLSIMPATWAAQAASDDLQGYWAEAQLREWVEGDLLKGDNGAYYPNRPITRAEIITLINRSFKFSESTKIDFSDVVSSHWAYGQAAIAVNAGYTKGYDDNTIRLNEPISREESAVMVANLIELDSSNSDSLVQFKDASSISAWSKSAVQALVNHSILVGDSAGNFNPQGKLTRAEAVVILDKALEFAKPTTTEYSTAGVYGPETGTETIKGNVVVSAPGVTLQNLTIEGNLTLTEGIGEGDAFFKKVTVHGTTAIQGGGENSIHFEDSVLVRISIDKRDGTVRVVVIGDTSVQFVVVSSPVKLEESNVTNTGFADVELSEDLPKGSKVQLTGKFEDLRVLSSDIKVSIPSGSINKIDVATGTTNTEIDASANVKIMELVLNAVAKLLGQGTVEKATVNSGAAGSSFQTPPASVDGSSSNTITTPTGTGNTSGNTGGNTGRDTDGNTCTGTIEQCNYAKLDNITLSGFTLNQQDSSQYSTDQTDFSPDVFAYSVVTARNMAPVTTTLTVTKSTYSTVSYAAWDTGSINVASGSITTEQNSFSFTLDIKQRQDIRIRITVTSGNGISSKTYEIITQYPRTIQEALKIGSGISTINSYNGTEEVITKKRYYSLQLGTIEGDKIRYGDTVKLFEIGENSPFVTGNYSVMIPDDKATGTGTWYVEIQRGGSLIASGNYNYNFTTATVLTGDIGLVAKAYTKQELIDMLSNYSAAQTPFMFGYNVQIDTAKLQSAVPQAKYAVEGSHEMFGTTNSLSPGLSFDEFKVGVQPNGYASFPMAYTYHIFSNPSESTQSLGGGLYQGGNASESMVDDRFVYLGLYDENFNFLGQYITVLQFDQEHLADGYTPVGNWNPVIN
jgi:hypothetical protein